MNTDPTKEEILNFLRNDPATKYVINDNESSVEEALYYIAYNYHTGQSSNLYSILSTSQYRPSVSFTGDIYADSHDDIPIYIYDAIVSFMFSKE